MCWREEASRVSFDVLAKSQVRVSAVEDFWIVIIAMGDVELFDAIILQPVQPVLVSGDLRQGTFNVHERGSDDRLAGFVVWVVRKSVSHQSVRMSGDVVQEGGEFGGHGGL